METSWEKASRLGRIHTFTIIPRPTTVVADAGPYVFAHIELAEGPRMLTYIVNCDPMSLDVDQEAEVVLHKAEDAIRLPSLRPR